MDDDSEGKGEGEGEGEGQPKYGEFGNTPTVDQLFEVITKEREDRENLKGKTTATEKSLASLRKGLKDAGIKILADPDDPSSVQFELEEPEEPAGPKKRFTDTHKQLFEDDVWDAIRAFVQDLQDEGFTAYNKKGAEARAFVVAKRNANVQMLQLYPALKQFDADGKELDTFDENFYDKATEIWQSRYRKHPEGELFGAHQAAIEMSIAPASIATAKKVAAKKAAAGKKILGPAAGPSARKPGPGAGRKLTQTEYLALNEEDRDKYDKQQKGIE